MSIHVLIGMKNPNTSHVFPMSSAAHRFGRVEFWILIIWFDFFPLRLPAANNNKYSIFKIWHVQIAELPRTLVSKSELNPGNPCPFFEHGILFFTAVIEQVGYVNFVEIAGPQNLMGGWPMVQSNWDETKFSAFKVRISNKWKCQIFNRY